MPDQPAHDYASPSCPAGQVLASAPCSRPLRHLDLFSGIGGFALAARMAGGFETIAFCEREDYAQQVLKKHWPTVPICNDIHKLKGNEYGSVQLVTGGYPCQPFSLAGNREGQDDDRHLWPEMRRVIADSGARWVVAENVIGHISMGLDEVLSDLDAIGYDAGACVLPACAVDACHRRDRVWIIANARGLGISRSQQNEIQRLAEVSWSQNGGGSQGVARMPALPASRLCGSRDGIPHRVDRLHALGNAIVPQVAAEILRAIRITHDSAVSANA